jgi:hypothetical protein
MDKCGANYVGLESINALFELASLISFIEYCKEFAATIRWRLFKRPPASTHVKQ